MQMKLYYLLVINTIITCIVVYNAYALKRQFYPTVVYIAKSKPSLLVLYIEALLVLVVYIKLVSKLLFGSITANEREQLYERIGPVFVDTCITFAVFSQSNANTFYSRLLCLFIVKNLHFMTHLRLQTMSTVDHLSYQSHQRFIGVMLYLWTIDVWQISMSWMRINKSGLSIEALYLFEYSILGLSLINIFLEYIIECIERQNGENSWDEKVVYFDTISIVISTIKLVLHLVMIAILIKMKIMPIFLIRPLVITYRNAKTCFWRAVQSHQAINRLNLFPNPKADDLVVDNMCAVCRDEIKTTESAKRLFCKHMFHIICLKNWLRRQQSCPTCRSNVMNMRPTQVAQQQHNGLQEQRPQDIHN
ncbi:E3 ubiquitin-protein ligase synoviolin A-like [Oppia nitens]|uniref:E3 ubiquitin-protein ligase synoviolin A-like n=1 Tax=Oppia nitens TaxID=1686743 RepID=UPI0023DB9AFB|nr:E3 ubiquitin-protein ligase synoviolin A-like [Oppia nitens]